MLSVANKLIMLSVFMLSVVMLNVVMLNVVVPFDDGHELCSLRCFTACHFNSSLIFDTNLCTFLALLASVCHYLTLSLMSIICHLSSIVAPLK